MARSLYALALLPALLSASASLAQTPPLSGGQAQTPLTAEQRKAALKSASDAAEKAAIPGPAEQAMLDEAKFSIEKGQIFIPHDEGAALMRAVGNRIGPTFVGLIMDPNADWLATVNFIKEGFVKDGDAKEWNADELLDSLRKGNDQTNEERRQRGFDTLDILGWIEPPAYDAATHRLVWSVAVHNHNAAPDVGDTVNYNTYLLGREGYFSIDFINPRATIEARKPLARQLLADLSFVPGKRYEDFSASTDKVATYGLAALIGGIALKKLGLLALGAAFFVKFAKLIALAFFGGIAAFKKFVLGKRKTPPAAEPSPLPRREETETP